MIFSWLHNYKVILIVALHCEASDLTIYVLPTLIDPKSSHFNITSNKLGIACSWLAIPLAPPPPIHVPISKWPYTFVCHPTHMLLLYHFVLCTHIHIFHGDDVFQAPQSVHVYNLRKFVYGLVHPL